MKTNVIGAMMLGLVASAVAQQPAPVQLNVPYHCPNNVTVVVKRCEKRNGTEVCFLVKGGANEQLGEEISMPRAQAAALGLLCTVQGGAPSAQAAAKPA